jgi:HK97 gp10 family phage protein
MNNVASVKFVDNSGEVKKTLQDLSKTALREGAKIVRKELRRSLPVRTKSLKNHIGSWVRINRDTGMTECQIGYYSWQKVRKLGKKPSHSSPYWLEFGTDSHLIQVQQNRKNKPPNRSGVMWYMKTPIGKQVKHPGQPAQHLLRNAAYNNIGAICKAQEKYLKYLNDTLAAAQAKADTFEGVEDD